MKNQLPVEIKLPEKVMLENGTMFVTLRTLDELQAFWSENKTKFPFAVRNMVIDPVFLRDYEWVFGATKAAVVQTVMRWGKSGIGCEFFDWAKSEPDWHRLWFKDRDSVRENAIRDGSWTEMNQAEYEADCILRTPDSYRGWWRLKNIPGEYGWDDWLSDYQEIYDTNLPIAEVERLLQEQTFDEWLSADLHLVRAFGVDELDSEISECLMARKNSDADYYGRENESVALSQSDSTLHPVAMSVVSRSVGHDELRMAAAQMEMEAASASTSPFSALTTAVETIVSELEMMLDEELDGPVSEIVDAHNAGYLRDAFEDATTALGAICELGVSGAGDALVAFLAFVETVSKPTIEEIREACDGIDLKEYLDDYVIKTIHDFDKLRDAEEDFDLIADERKAFPPAKAD